MSERVKDSSAGWNGGFESASGGLPVNWLVYSPRTVPQGEFEIHLDRSDFVEGAQALKFIVEDCQPNGGWGSPGIAQQTPADEGETYRVGFWVKSEGCDWVVSIGAVAPKAGTSQELHSTEVEPGVWQHVTRDQLVEAGHDELRFELSIRSAGTLWIDDVTIEPVGG